MIVLFDDVLSFIHVVGGFLSAFFCPLVLIFGGWEVYELIFGEPVRIFMGDIVEFLVGIIAGTITKRFVEEAADWPDDWLVCLNCLHRKEEGEKSFCRQFITRIWR